MIARWFWREWRSPSLLIVWLALSLAVACVLELYTAFRIPSELEKEGRGKTDNKFKNGKDNLKM